MDAAELRHVTRDEREKRYATKHEYLPNGTFTFEFSDTEYGIGHTYKDGKSEKLEQQLAQIARPSWTPRRTRRS